MTDSEERFTLNEARDAIAREDCALNGHSWTVIETYAGPQGISCDRCGKSHALAEQP